MPIHIDHISNLFRDALQFVSLRPILPPRHRPEVLKQVFQHGGHADTHNVMRRRLPLIPVRPLWHHPVRRSPFPRALPAAEVLAAFAPHPVLRFYLPTVRTLKRSQRHSLSLPFHSPYQILRAVDAKHQRIKLTLHVHALRFKPLPKLPLEFLRFLRRLRQLMQPISDSQRYSHPQKHILPYLVSSRFAYLPALYQTLQVEYVAPKSGDSGPHPPLLCFLSAPYPPHARRVPSMLP